MSSKSRHLFSTKSGLKGALPEVWQILTKADKLLILSVLICTIGLFLLHNSSSRMSREVTVLLNGQQRGPYPLSEPQILRFEGPLGASEVEIANQAVRIVTSPCPRKICVNMGWIQRPGEVAACLPNHLLLQTIGAVGEGGLDAVSR